MDNKENDNNDHNSNEDEELEEENNNDNGEDFGLSTFINDAKEVLTFNGRERTYLYKAYTYSLIALLVALLPLAYDYYGLLRAVVAVSAVLFLEKSWKLEDMGWRALLIGIAILYNPFFPIHLGEKVIWMFINILTLYVLFRARKAFDKPSPDIDI